MSTHEASYNQVREELRFDLSSAQRRLQQTAEYTKASSQSLEYAEELSTIVAGQTHREISRLQRITNELETGLQYLVYRWMEPTWRYTQPGLKREKADRLMAAEVLEELVRIIDMTAQVLILVSSSQSAPG